MNSSDLSWKWPVFHGSLGIKKELDAWDSRYFSHLTGWRGSTASQSRWDMDCTWLEGHGAMRNANGCHWFWMVLGIKVRSFLFRERSLAVWITVVRLLHSERIAPNYKKHSRQAWRPCHGIIWSFNVVHFVWEGQQKHVCHHVSHWETLRSCLVWTEAPVITKASVS